MAEFAGKSSDNWLPSLAAFVVRQFRQTYYEGRIISQHDKVRQNMSGLTPEDRAAMAAVSRVLLQGGVPDVASQPNDLLTLCSQPLKFWIGHVLGEDDPLRETLLIDPDENVPTVDCFELARGFSGELASGEEELFNEFLQTVRSKFTARAPEVYSLVREWIVRHPIVSRDQIVKFLNDNLLAPLTDFVFGSVYESIPSGYENEEGRVPLCKHCGSHMRPDQTGELACSVRQCRMNRSPDPQPGPEWGPDIMKVNRAVSVYWIGPGQDEIAIHDAAVLAGLDPVLYHQMDACDVFIPPTTGVDAKSYICPLTLASKLNTGVGRLNEYNNKILAVGDELLRMNPHYLRQLRGALDGDATTLEVKTVTQVLRKLRRAQPAERL